MNVLKVDKSEGNVLEHYRNYGVRLREFCKLKGYKLIADTMDYVVLENEEGRRFNCSGYSVHLAMLKEGIR